MSDPRKQWAIVQKRVPPPAHWRKHKNALTSWKVAYAELVAALPRPVSIWFDGGTWNTDCRLHDATLDEFMPTHAEAFDAALRHLHDAHGCPNRRTTGEPCDPQCVHCHGWQWCAQPNERRDL